MKEATITFISLHLVGNKSAEDGMVLAESGLALSENMRDLLADYFPFFRRCFTHSVSRYSICPFTERKSASAHAAMAL